MSIKCQTPGCPHDAKHRLMTNYGPIELCPKCLNIIVGAYREKLRTEEIRDEYEMRMIHGRPTFPDTIAKPPLGLMPRRIWMEHRMKDIQEAITRATDPRKLREYSAELFDLVNMWEDTEPEPTKT